ncbi:MAG: PAS domain S-box protein [Thermodesulfobacteriota bacterium]
MKPKKPGRPSPLPGPVLAQKVSNPSAAMDACGIDRERYRVFIEDVADGFYETNLNGDFVFFNEAFCRIFGLGCAEMQNRNYCEFMDKKNAEIAFEHFNRIYRTGEGFTDIIWDITRKDGERRILKISAKLIFDDHRQKIGFRGIARDITRERRAARSNQALFRIAKALPLFRQLDQLLEFIIKEVQDLLAVEGASVILLDEEKQEFYFPAATYDDKEAGKRMREIRFPADKGVAGHVYRTGQPMIVPDTSKSPYFFKKVDEKSAYQTRNMLDVPIRIQDRMIGVLCAVNKKERGFDQADVFLLGTIASTVAHPIENARINEALKRSYEEVKSLNRAKDRVINHLSHELKTPVSVLAASLSLLSKNLTEQKTDKGWERALERAQRNLKRILEMQYQVEDILRERDYKAHTMLSALLDVCTDELEALITEELGDVDAVEKIRNRIENLFGPRHLAPQTIQLDRFIRRHLKHLRPRFSHRKCLLKTRISATAPILIPEEVLSKIVEGLIRNAVENTPDGGRIEIIVKTGENGPELIVKDHGIGITEENQRLIFESTFTTSETVNYSTKSPFDFYAGGKGFDLLRMKIFSERYHFAIRMESSRCRFIPQDRDLCPGDISACSHCRTPDDCLNSGGTAMTLRFLPANRIASLNQSMVYETITSDGEKHDYIAKFS